MIKEHLSFFIFLKCFFLIYSFILLQTVGKTSKLQHTEWNHIPWIWVWTFFQEGKKMSSSLHGYSIFTQRTQAVLLVSTRCKVTNWPMVGIITILYQKYSVLSHLQMSWMKTCQFPQDFLWRSTSLNMSKCLPCKPFWETCLPFLSLLRLWAAKVLVYHNKFWWHTLIYVCSCKVIKQEVQRLVIL